MRSVPNSPFNLEKLTLPGSAWIPISCRNWTMAGRAAEKLHWHGGAWQCGRPKTVGRSCSPQRCHLQRKFEHHFFKHFGDQISTSKRGRFEVARNPLSKMPKPAGRFCPPQRGHVQKKSEHYFFKQYGTQISISKRRRVQVALNPFLKMPRIRT